MIAYQRILHRVCPPIWQLGSISQSLAQTSILHHHDHYGRFKSNVAARKENKLLEIKPHSVNYEESRIPDAEEQINTEEEDIMENKLAFGGDILKSEGHWGHAMDKIIQEENELDEPRPSENDLASVRAAHPTQTLTALVQESSTLKRLVDLGVPLHLWDTNNQLGLAVKLDFDRDVAPIVRFLADVGIDPDDIGDVLGGNPGLFEEELEDLHTRVNYLTSKLFSRQQIVQLICGSPKWLSFPVALIDARLGFFQKTFGLIGQEVRDMAVGRPSLITWKGTPAKVKKHIFSLDEEMGFSREELKRMIVEHPTLLKRDDSLVLKCFEVLHCEAGIPHHVLAHFPTALTGNPLEIAERHQFLKSLGRAQYDPGKPQYVSPAALTEGSDVEFAEKVARSNIQLYNAFLKTL